MNRIYKLFMSKCRSCGRKHKTFGAKHKAKVRLSLQLKREGWDG